MARWCVAITMISEWPIVLSTHSARAYAARWITSPPPLLPSRAPDAISGLPYSKVPDSQGQKTRRVRMSLRLCSLRFVLLRVSDILDGLLDGLLLGPVLCRGVSQGSERRDDPEAAVAKPTSPPNTIAHGANPLRGAVAFEGVVVTTSKTHPCPASSPASRRGLKCRRVP